jgi:signal transduction histidine kinase
VARGLADFSLVDATLIRIAFVVLSLAGGLGVVLYLGLALVLQEGASSDVLPEGRRTGLRAGASVALITAGLMLAARSAGFWFGDALVGPIAIAAVGAAVLWIRGDASGATREEAANPLEVLMQGRVSPLRVLFGAILIFIGAGTFLAANASYGGPFQVIRILVLPVLATVAGLVLIFGPWLYRLASQLTDERRERIRSEERTTLATHLHDSVLQTLALIQRTDDPQRMNHLARTQERELRAWLFGKVAPEAGETLSDVLQGLAGKCESRYPVMVDVVTVGDVALDERVKELAAACGEAINNAAKHSDAGAVSVYAEVEPEVATIYVRDEGRGFSVTDVGPDRRGISDSIEGRMKRVGGTASIQTEAGRGTEVTLTLPMNAS